MNTTQGEHDQTEALDDLYLKLHGMSKRLESSGRIDESDAPEAYPAILDAMNLVRRLQSEAAQVPATTAQPVQDYAELLESDEHIGTEERNEIAAELRRLHAQVAALTAQPAPQGVAYAELPEPDSYLFQHDETGLTQFVDAQQVEWGFQQNNPRLRRIGGAYTADKMRDFADRTHALRASHGQAPASRITVEQVEDAIGLQSTAWDTIGAEKIVEAVLRLANGQAPAGAAPEPIAYLHDDGYWTPTKTAEGRKLNDRLHFAGSPKIGVHLAPTAQAAPAAGAVAGWLPVHFNGCGFYGAPLKTEAEANQYIEQVHQSSDSVTLIARPFAWVAAPTPADQADGAQDEPLQAFDSPRAKALMRAWEEGWAACRDAEYVGEEAQNDAFNSSHTLTLCIAEDQQLPAPQADSQPLLRDWTTPDDPVQALDAIMAVYEKCMGTTPGPEMAHVVSKTKEMLFDWWGRYRERAREALVKTDSVLEDAARLAKITQAIRDYHFALDNREHGGVAMARAWNAICDVLNTDWVQGAESAARKQGDKHDNH